MILVINVIFKFLHQACITSSSNIRNNKMIAPILAANSIHFTNAYVETYFIGNGLTFLRTAKQNYTKTITAHSTYILNWLY